MSTSSSPADKAALFHREIWWESGPRCVVAFRQAGHPKPVLRSLGQLDQDIFRSSCGRSARASFRARSFELAQSADGTGGRLARHACCFVGAQTAVFRPVPGNNTNLPLSRVIGDTVSDRSPPVSNRAHASSDWQCSSARARSLVLVSPKLKCQQRKEA